MRDLDAVLGWMEHGTFVFSSALARTSDDALDGPTALPGWTGRHLVAHVAANAQALGNLARWARTGVETPMYSSPEQRDADISNGATRSPPQLRRWVDDSAAALDAALANLSADHWHRQVRTAQGRLVAATEIPWLRAREVMVHAVDLDPALGFGELPEAFLLALTSDVVARRSAAGQPVLLLRADDNGATWSVSGAGEPTEVHGSLGGVVAYLTGRPGADVVSTTGDPPDLPPWL